MPIQSKFFLRFLPRSLPLLVATAAFLLPAAAWADSVTLKNGDHLTGKVAQLADGKLTVTTTYAGAIVISWDEVTDVKLEKSLILPIENKSGKKVDIRKMEVTAIERTSAGFVVTTASGQEPVPPTSLTTLRDAAAEKAYEDSLHPSFVHGWTGAANVSLALARGNSKTTSIGTGINAVRPTRTDKTSLYFTTLYARNGQTETTTAQTTAKSTNAGLRYDHNVNPKLFAFGTGDFAVDALQNLDLRTVVGGGFGWHAIAKPVQTFDVLGGIVWTHESYSAVLATDTPASTNSFAALDFGQQYTRKLGKSSSFTEQAYIFPDLHDTSQFRFTLNSGLSTRIASFLNWQTNLSDIYVTNPPDGTKGNNLILTTGLGFNFNLK